MNGNEITACTDGNERSFIFPSILFDYKDCYLAVDLSCKDGVENLEHFRKILQELWGERSGD